MVFTVHFPWVHHIVATYKIGKVPARHPVHPGSILRLNTQTFTNSLWPLARFGRFVNLLVSRLSSREVSTSPDSKAVVYFKCEPSDLAALNHPLSPISVVKRVCSVVLYCSCRRGDNVAGAARRGGADKRVPWPTNKSVTEIGGRRADLAAVSLCRACSAKGPLIQTAQLFLFFAP